MLRQEQIDRLREVSVSAPSMIIDGKPRTTADAMPVFSSLDLSGLTHIPMADESDIKAAVAAARRSFEKGFRAGYVKSLHAIEKLINHETAWFKL